jgi:hypothetical protein
VKAKVVSSSKERVDMVSLNSVDMSVIVSCVAVVLGIWIGYRGFTHGTPKSLCEAKVGEVYNFEYLQPLNGEPERYLAKVISPVCTFDNSTIDRMNKRSSYRRNDSSFMRTNHLVTCKTQDGEVRQFYCERAINCRKPFLAGLFI